MEKEFSKLTFVFFMTYSSNAIGSYKEKRAKLLFFTKKCYIFENERIIKKSFK
jgi:hypothetical protein